MAPQMNQFGQNLNLYNRSTYWMYIAYFVTFEQCNSKKIQTMCSTAIDV